MRSEYFASCKDGKNVGKCVHNIVVAPSFHKLELKELIRLTSLENTHALTYKNGYILFSYIVQRNTITKDGNFINWDFVTETNYAAVKEYHKFIFFDDIYNMCEYRDDVDDLQGKGESTKCIAILKSSDIIIDTVYDELLKWEKNNERKKK
jgi:hypothetical protein